LEMKKEKKRQEIVEKVKTEEEIKKKALDVKFQKEDSKKEKLLEK